MLQKYHKNSLFKYKNRDKVVCVLEIQFIYLFIYFSATKQNKNKSKQPSKDVNQINNFSCHSKHEAEILVVIEMFCSFIMYFLFLFSSIYKKAHIKIIIIKKNSLDFKEIRIWYLSWSKGLCLIIVCGGLKWRPAMGGLPQQLVLGLMLFNIFINTDSVIDCTLSKFSDDIKLSDATDTIEGKDAIQKDLYRLKK